jgi:Ca2+-dependent lipid-binding protein
METKFIVLRSLDDFLTLSLFDHHEYRKHRFLGESGYQLSKLKEDVIQSGLLLPLLRNEKPRGDILVDLIYYPLVKTHDSSCYRKYKEVDVGFV